MFKDITGLRISGGVFQKPAFLNNILSSRMNLLYGRNGSGKSTIARSLMQAQENPDGPNDYSASFLGAGQLPSPSAKGIFVFNEDFVDKNFKMKENLRAIVMLGKNAQLDGPIQEAEKEIKQLDAELKQLKLEAEPYESGAGDKSISYSENKVKECLKQNYLPRLADIEGRKLNLTQSLADAVLGGQLIEPAEFKSVTDFSNDIDSRVKKYLSCKYGGKVDWVVPAWTIDIDKVNEILEKTVQPAGLTEEDNALLDFLSGEANASFNYLEKTQSVIIDGYTGICPLCHQTISGDHRAMLKSRLERFRDKQTDEFKSAILSTITALSQVEDNLPAFPVSYYDADVNAAKDCIAKANAYVGSVKSALESKLNNPYTVAGGLDKAEYETICSNLAGSFNKLEKDVKEFNDSVLENDILLQKIKEDNITQALWQYKAEIQRYRDNITEKERLVGKDGNGGQYAVVRTKMDAARENLNALRRKSEPIGEAVNIINKYLRLIFDRNRLQLDACGKDKYKILSRGCEVPPKAVSAGERNAIALAYFFACVVEHKEEGYNYSDPTLLVIDDPVSSFDFENRAGILSLLGAQCKKVMDGNDESKILILTHDLTTVKDLISIRDTLSKDKDTYCYILERQKIREVKSSSINDMTDYRSRLSSMFFFANLEEANFDNNDTSIGNTTRKVLEQYATFRYGKPWHCLFSDENILSKLPDDKRDIFRNLKFRSALHPESHGTELILDIADLQKLIKDVLIFLYLTDEPHLAAHLKPDETNTVAQWANDR